MGGFDVQSEPATLTSSGERAQVVVPDSARPLEVEADVASRPADRFWRDVRRRRMLAVADLFSGFIATFMLAPDPTEAIWALLFLPGWVVIAKLLGLYDRDQGALRHQTIDELPSIAAWSAAGVAGV